MWEYLKQWYYYLFGWDKVVVRKTDPKETPLSITIGEWADVMTIKATVPFKTADVIVKFKGDWVDSASGYRLRMIRGNKTLRTTSVMSSTQNQLFKLKTSEKNRTGELEYKIQVKNTVQGGLNLGLKNKEMKIVFWGKK